MISQEAKHAFLRDLARNTARGQLSSAREGRAGTGGPSPYGYRSKDGQVWVVPEEAKIVKWVFQQYLRPGGSLRGIAAELNRRQIPPPRGKVWRDSSVRAILARRKYTGTFVYGERNAGRYFCWRGGEVVARRKSDKTTASDPIVHEDRFEAIIDQETFDKVQAKLAIRASKTAPRKARQYLLSGLVRCGGAMGGLSGSGVPGYKCRTYHQTGTTSCYCNTITEAPLVSVIVRKIQERYLSDSALARLRRELEKAQERTRPRPRDLDQLRREIDSLGQKIDRGAERVLEAPSDLLPTIYRKLEDLRSEQDRLKAELDALTSRETVSNGRDDSEIDQAIEALRSLGEALRKAKPADAKDLLSSIVTKIELYFEDDTTGRRKRAFSYGQIYVRPAAGENRWTESGPEGTQLSKIRPKYRTAPRPKAGQQRRRPRPLRWGNASGATCVGISIRFPGMSLPRQFGPRRPTACPKFPRFSRTPELGSTIAHVSPSVPAQSCSCSGTRSGVKGGTVVYMPRKEGRTTRDQILPDRTLTRSPKTLIY